MSDNNELLNIIDKMYSEMQEDFFKVIKGMNKLQENLNEIMDKLEKQVSKNGMLLEKVDINIELFVEEVKNFSNTMEVVKEITGANSLDLKILKILNSKKI
jgi:hypothetical protein